LTRKAKLYAKARVNPRGLRFAEFVALVKAFGFAFDHQTGSHRIHKHATIGRIVNVQPASDGKAKAVQVRAFLAIIERYGLSLEDEG